MSEKINRAWGWYSVLSENYDPTNDIKAVKVKELVILPGKSISLQRHSFRNEHWYIHTGYGYLETSPAEDPCDFLETKDIKPGDYIHIPVTHWHRIGCDAASIPMTIIEIQYGEKCVEDDIERISITHPLAELP